MKWTKTTGKDGGMRSVALLVTLALAWLPGAALGAGSPQTVLAYIDPGAGSFILQALVATLAGAAVAVHAYWRKIKSFLGFAGADEDDDAARREQPRDEP